MVFRGIYPARELTPAPCGLLGVADVKTHRRTVVDERWINGYSAEFDTNPDTVRILPAFSVTSDPDAIVYKADDKTFNHIDVEPFYIEVINHASGNGLVIDDVFARSIRQLEAVSQKAIERELWTGAAAKSDNTKNNFLTKAGGAKIITTGGVNPKKAMYLAEQAISNSATGGGGVIHMTRDVAAALFGGNLVSEVDPEGQITVTTSLGTPVVVGSGYTGDGPDGATGVAATASNKWVFVTGPLEVHMGKSEVTQDSRAQSFISSTNDLTVQATRPASVYFDPTIFYAIQVTIPDVP